jgi:hypothetical protein
MKNEEVLHIFWESLAQVSTTHGELLKELIFKILH